MDHLNLILPHRELRPEGEKLTVMWGGERRWIQKERRNDSFWAVKTVKLATPLSTSPPIAYECTSKTRVLAPDFCILFHRWRWCCQVYSRLWIPDPLDIDYCGYAADLMKLEHLTATHGAISNGGALTCGSFELIDKTPLNALTLRDPI